MKKIGSIRLFYLVLCITLIGTDGNAGRGKEAKKKGATLVSVQEPFAENPAYEFGGTRDWMKKYQVFNKKMSDILTQIPDEDLKKEASTWILDFAKRLGGSLIDDKEKELIIEKLLNLLDAEIKTISEVAYDLSLSEDQQKNDQWYIFTVLKNTAESLLTEVSGDNGSWCEVFQNLKIGMKDFLSKNRLICNGLVVVGSCALTLYYLNFFDNDPCSNFDAQEGQLAKDIVQWKLLGEPCEMRRALMVRLKALRDCE